MQKNTKNTMLLLDKLCLSGHVAPDFQALESTYSAFRNNFDDLVSYIRELFHISVWHSLDYKDNPYRELALAIAEAIDQMNSKMSVEPAYHSRWHFMDACAGISLLLNQDTEQARNLLPKKWQLSAADKWLLLCCAIGHDFAHEGGVNQQAFELEKKSCELIDQCLTKLPAHTQALLIAEHGSIQALSQRIQTIILCTDPGILHPMLKEVQDLPDDGPTTPKVMGLLLVEADLLASVTPNFGLALGAALGHEWQTSNPEKADFVASLEGRLGFLKYIQFVSPFARSFKLPELRQLAIDQVNQTLAK